MVEPGNAVPGGALEVQGVFPKRVMKALFEARFHAIVALLAAEKRAVYGCPKAAILSLLNGECKLQTC